MNHPINQVSPSPTCVRLTYLNLILITTPTTTTTTTNNQETTRTSNPLFVNTFIRFDPNPNLVSVYTYSLSAACLQCLHTVFSPIRKVPILLHPSSSAFYSCSWPSIKSIWELKSSFYCLRFSLFRTTDDLVITDFLSSTTNTTQIACLLYMIIEYGTESSLVDSELGHTQVLYNPYFKSLISHATRNLQV